MVESINVTRSYMPPFEEYIKQIKPLWDTAWLTNNGKLHQELEEDLANYLKVNRLCLFTNGHLALELAIRSLDLTGEVITTPFTFASTTHAIVNNGLKPVFCDIKIDDCTIDTSKIEALITEKTSAIIPVHVYGNVCDIKEVERIARKYRLKVIYDAAHAFGVEVNGQGIGCFGDISMFSFHATKVFHTIEGGALTFSDRNLYQTLSNKKNFGILSAEDVVDIGINAKMNEFQAAMGLVNLRHIDEQIQLRKKIVERYRRNLYEVEGIRLLDSIPGVKENYAYFTVIIDERLYGKSRDNVFEKLKTYNINTRKYFYPLVSDYTCYKNQYNSSDTPVAKYIADRVLALPLYTELKLKQVDFICELLKDKK